MSAGKTKRSNCCDEQEPSGKNDCQTSIMLFINAAQEINVQNMNVELVAQMFKNYQSNVLFHLEGALLLKCDD